MAFKTVFMEDEKDRHQIGNSNNSNSSRKKKRRPPPPPPPPPPLTTKSATKTTTVLSAIVTMMSTNNDDGTTNTHAGKMIAELSQQHAFNPLAAALLSSVGLGLLAAAAASCSFVVVLASATPSTDGDGDGEGENGNLVMLESRTFDVETPRNEATLGLLCGGDGYYDLQEETMWIVSRAFAFASLAVVSLSTIVAWGISTVCLPTWTAWKLISALSALSAVVQIPCFLLFETTPCSQYRSQQTCHMSTGSALLVSSVVCSIAVTLLTQLLDPPTWVGALDEWRVDKSATAQSSMSKSSNDEDEREDIERQFLAYNTSSRLGNNVGGGQERRLQEAHQQPPPSHLPEAGAAAAAAAAAERKQQQNAEAACGNSSSSDYSDRSLLLKLCRWNQKNRVGAAEDKNNNRSSNGKRRRRRFRSGRRREDPEVPIPPSTNAQQEDAIFQGGDSDVDVEAGRAGRIRMAIAADRSSRAPAATRGGGGAASSAKANTSTETNWPPFSPDQLIDTDDAVASYDDQYDDYDYDAGGCILDHVVITPVESRDRNRKLAPREREREEEAVPSVVPNALRNKSSGAGNERVNIPPIFPHNSGGSNNNERVNIVLFGGDPAEVGGVAGESGGNGQAPRSPTPLPDPIIAVTDSKPAANRKVNNDRKKESPRRSNINKKRREPNIFEKNRKRIVSKAKGYALLDDDDLESSLPISPPLEIVTVKVPGNDDTTTGNDDDDMLDVGVGIETENEQEEELLDLWNALYNSDGPVAPIFTTEKVPVEERTAEQQQNQSENLSDSLFSDSLFSDLMQEHSLASDDLDPEAPPPQEGEKEKEKGAAADEQQTSEEEYIIAEVQRRMPPRHHRRRHSGGSTSSKRRRKRSGKFPKSSASVTSSPSLLDTMIKEETPTDLEESESDTVERRRRRAAEAAREESFDPYGGLPRTRSLPNIAAMYGIVTDDDEDGDDGEAGDGVDSDILLQDESTSRLTGPTPADRARVRQPQHSDSKLPAQEAVSPLSLDDNCSQASSLGGASEKHRKVPIFREERDLRGGIHDVPADDSSVLSEITDDASHLYKAAVREARIQRLQKTVQGELRRPSPREDNVVRPSSPEDDVEEEPFDVPRLPKTEQEDEEKPFDIVGAESPVRVQGREDEEEEKEEGEEEEKPPQQQAPTLDSNWVPRTNEEEKVEEEPSLVFNWVPCTDNEEKVEEESLLAINTVPSNDSSDLESVMLDLQLIGLQRPDGVEYGPEEASL